MAEPTAVDPQYKYLHRVLQPAEDGDGFHAVEAYATDAGPGENTSRVSLEGAQALLSANEGWQVLNPGEEPAPVKERLDLLQGRAAQSPGTRPVLLASGEVSHVPAEDYEKAIRSPEAAPYLTPEQAAQVHGAAEAGRDRRLAEAQSAITPRPSTALMPLAPVADVALRLAGKEAPDRAPLDRALTQAFTSPIAPFAPGLAAANALASPEVRSTAEQYVQRGGEALRDVASKALPNLVSPAAPKPAMAASAPPPRDAFLPPPTVQPAMATSMAPPVDPLQAEALRLLQGSTTTVSGFVPASGGGKGQVAMDAATAKLQAAMGEEAAVAAKAASAEAAAQAAALEELKALQLRNEEAAAQQRAEMERFATSMAETQKQIESTTGSVDPDRWWRGRSTGQKVLAGIAQFLSGVARTTDPIKEAIQQDIQLQIRDAERLDKKNQTKLANMQILYGLMRDRFGDDLAARQAAEVSALGIARQRLSVVAAGSKSEEVKARAQTAIAELTTQQAAKQEELRLRWAQLAQQGSFQQQQLNMQRAGALLEVSNAQRKAGMGIPDPQVTGDMDPNILSPDQRERFIPGLGLAASKEEAKNVRKAKTNYESAAGDVDKLIRFRDEYGAEVLPSAKAAAAKATAKQLGLKIKDLYELGALDKGSQEYLESLIGDPTEIGYVMPKLEALRDGLRDRYKFQRANSMATQVDARGLQLTQPAQR